MKISSIKSFRRAILPASILAAMAFSGSASAFKIDTDNPDLDIRWDNTVRYNAGWRAEDPTYYQLSGAAGAAAEKFNKAGDLVTNRIDVLSEFDFIYHKDTGFRVSAAGWYDSVYDGNPGTKPMEQAFFPTNKYPDQIKRYYAGPSGEFLDAFVFTKFDFGDVPVNVKLGQHTIYWGESIFNLGDGVAAGQSNADLRKALASPGIEAKEVFKPLNQFSFSAQISPEFTVMGQYYFDWAPDLVPLGGTYFSPADFLTYAGGTTAQPGVGWDGITNRPKKSGDYGLAAKWRPEWLDGTAGFYYREYTPKSPNLLVNTNNLGGPFVAGVVMDNLAPRTKLYGFSLAKQVWGISWGMDLTYRTDASLQMPAFGLINTGLPVGTNLGPFGYARGTSVNGFQPTGSLYTGVFNMIAYDGKRGIGDFNLYDSAVLTAEFNADMMDKVDNKNSSNWFNCTNPTGAFAANGFKNMGGCITNQSMGISALFEPKWFQVFPGTDLSMPLFYSVGLKGNSPVPLFGSVEHAGAYSIGVTADVDAKYNFALKYNGNIYKHLNESFNGTALAHSANAPLGDGSHHDFISFTAKATW